MQCLQHTLSTVVQACIAASYAYVHAVSWLALPGEDTWQMPQVSAEADVVSWNVLQPKADAPLVMSYALCQMSYAMCQMSMCYVILCVTCVLCLADCRCCCIRHKWHQRASNHQSSSLRLQTLNTGSDAICRDGLTQLFKTSTARDCNNHCCFMATLSKSDLLSKTKLHCWWWCGAALQIWQWGLMLKLPSLLPRLRTWVPLQHRTAEWPSLFFPFFHLYNIGFYCFYAVPCWLLCADKIAAHNIVGFHLLLCSRWISSFLKHLPSIYPVRCRDWWDAVRPKITSKVISSRFSRRLQMLKLRALLTGLQGTLWSSNIWFGKATSHSNQ